MKAKEVRIGNWIHILDGGSDYQLKNVDDLGLIDCGSGSEGIPLTNEWLIGLGFYETAKKWGFREYIYFNNNITPRMWSIKLWGNERKAHEHKHGKYLWAKVEIKYVHQLQNLYFALTNEELTIKSSNTVD